MATTACQQQQEAPAPKPSPQPTATGPDAAKLLERSKSVFKPLPEFIADARPSQELIALGRTLYYEPRLSKSGEISCNTCHDLEKYGVDGKPTSPGHDGQLGNRNSPTCYNAALHSTQFWDGRAPDVEEQAKGPVLNPVEMAMPDEATVVKTLKAIPGYGKLFKAAFPDDPRPLTFDNVAIAIGAFERGLVTPAPFDKFLGGDENALSPKQLAGLQAYLDTGCQMCHAGAALGGTGFFKLGQVEPYATEDGGRYEVTHNDSDKHVFKPPSMRNVAKTAPYFHDGSVARLGEAVRLMAKHQNGKELDQQQVDRIVAFLGSLTGEIDLAYIAEPQLPGMKPSSDQAQEPSRGSSAAKSKPAQGRKQGK